MNTLPQSILFLKTPTYRFGARAALCGFFFLVAACAGAPTTPAATPSLPPQPSPTRAAAATGSPEQEVRGTASPPGVRMYAEMSASFVEGHLGSYCWSPGEGSGGEALCEAVEVPSFDSFTASFTARWIDLAFDEPWPDLVSVDLLQEDSLEALVKLETFPALASGEVYWMAPEALSGDHILRVIGLWEGRGSATYYFPLTFPPYDPSFPRPPLLFLESGEGKVPGVLGGYCWGGYCADGPVFVEEFTPLAKGEAIELVFEALPPERLNLNLYDTTTALDFEFGGEPLAEEEFEPATETISWTVDVPAGYYQLRAFADWDDYGDASYYFGVIILPR